MNFRAKEKAKKEKSVSTSNSSNDESSQSSLESDEEGEPYPISESEEMEKATKPQGNQDNQELFVESSTGKFKKMTALELNKEAEKNAAEKDNQLKLKTSSTYLSAFEEFLDVTFYYYHFIIFIRLLVLLLDLFETF